MYANRVRLVAHVVIGICAVGLLGGPVFAQAGGDHSAHEHAAHAVDDGSPPPTRDGSGTAWLPDESPMFAIHRPAGDWTVMLHGTAFLQYLHESGARGDGQVGSINWFMAMGERAAGRGRLTLRGMISAEPWTIGGCGYPNLLATGEVCEGAAIHDRQHPHDLAMEIAASYDRPLGRGLRLQLYGGPVGEPALGPVAFMHRVSALPNPIAPITHHWFDSTHVTFGVATAGVYGNRWKLESSVFNGREPDEHRTDFDFGRMDSYSARAWLLPTSRWALQVSGGHLAEAEADHDGEGRTDVDRVTASATYHRTTLEQTWWATTVGWGRNAASDGATHALFGESSLTFRNRDSLYGRAEWSQKSDHDLVVPAAGVFDVVKLEGGYTRYLPPWHGLTPGIGAAVSTGIVPAALSPDYGGRTNPGVAMYLTVRPGAHE